MPDADNAGPAGAVDITFAVRIPDVDACGTVGRRINLPQIAIKT
jgi:hypothetical protein